MTLRRYRNPLGLRLLARCTGVNGQRVNAAGQLISQDSINQAMAFEPGLPYKGRRYDIDPEMGLAAGPGAGMSRMLAGFVLNLENLGRESGG